VANVRSVECPGAKKLGHHDARFGETHFRAKARRMCGSGDHHLPVAKHVVKRIVAAKSNDMLSARFGDNEPFIAHGALEEADGDRTLPDGKCADAVFDGGHSGPRLICAALSRANFTLSIKLVAISAFLTAHTPRDL